MRPQWLIPVLAALSPVAANCAPIVLPNFASIALNDWRIPATRLNDRYTPAGFENVGGMFGMGSLWSVDPITADAYRNRHRDDEFPYHQPPPRWEAGRAMDPAPIGFYAWLYLPDWAPPGLLRTAVPPPEYAMIAFPDRSDPDLRNAAPRLCDAWTLVALKLPGASRSAAAPVPAVLGEGTRFYVVGSSAAVDNARYARLQVAEQEAGLGGVPESTRPERSLVGRR